MSFALFLSRVDALLFQYSSPWAHASRSSKPSQSFPRDSGPRVLGFAKPLAWCSWGLRFPLADRPPHNFLPPHRHLSLSHVSSLPLFPFLLLAAAMQTAGRAAGSTVGDLLESGLTSGEFDSYLGRVVESTGARIPTVSQANGFPATSYQVSNTPIPDPCHCPRLFHDVFQSR